MNAENIATHLAADAAFRECFFRSPRQALRTISVEVSDEDLLRIERGPWTHRPRVASQFDDRRVVRCCVEY
ncbi:MAG: hypothetical protein A2107_06835 [Verrucomicrobia bacterium GWF2_62_7]|nr:MAG: hypothetical protein A2107_06835 [Verrucomicrobia bacterium GWF2_62_7]